MTVMSDRARGMVTGVAMMAAVAACGPTARPQPVTTSEPASSTPGGLPASQDLVLHLEADATHVTLDAGGVSV